MEDVETQILIHDLLVVMALVRWKVTRYKWNMLTALRRSHHGLRLSSARMISSIDYDFTNLIEMQENSCKTNKDRNLFGTKKGKTFEWMTFGEFGKQV